MQIQLRTLYVVFPKKKSYILKCGLNVENLWNRHIYTVLGPGNSLTFVTFFFVTFSDIIRNTGSFVTWKSSQWVRLNESGKFFWVSLWARDPSLRLYRLWSGRQTGMCWWQKAGQGPQGSTINPLCRSSWGSSSFINLLDQLKTNKSDGRLNVTRNTSQISSADTIQTSLLQNWKWF